MTTLSRSSNAERSQGRGPRAVPLTDWARRLRRHHRHRALQRNAEWILQARRTRTVWEEQVERAS
jgi:hypothetical protein